MTRNNKKHYYELKIQELIENMKKDGITLAVASDEEGNGFNEVNSLLLFYHDTKPNKIVLSVWKFIGEDELFNNNQNL